MVFVAAFEFRSGDAGFAVGEDKDGVSHFVCCSMNAGGRLMCWGLFEECWEGGFGDRGSLLGECRRARWRSEMVSRMAAALLNILTYLLIRATYSQPPPVICAAVSDTTLRHHPSPACTKADTFWSCRQLIRGRRRVVSSCAFRKSATPCAEYEPYRNVFNLRQRSGVLRHGGRSPRRRLQFSKAGYPVASLSSYRSRCSFQPDTMSGR